MTERDWAAAFNETFATAVSPVHVEVFRAALGDEYPDGLDIHSYLSRTELSRFVDEVRVSDSDVLVDIGCGRGGPGLWVAATTGARLIGIDIADTALAEARSRATALGMADRAEFQIGSFESLPLGSGIADAVMSVDALLFTPDKAVAIVELARVIRPGGRLVFTSWDYSRQPAGRPPQVADHRTLLEAAGFAVLAYEETEDWRGRQTRVGDGLLAHVAELAADKGVDVAELRAEIEEMQTTIDAMIRRVLVVAERS
ncbi:MAG TPA: class I SAM-dependent methyltransferase [Jatrophihabitantaceae bacterium]|nr:class I SAM-dependent methyltransferase [Jatrophihabitantaceae bacterium]